QEQGVPGQRRRCPAPLADLVLAEQFELRPRLEYKRLAVLIQAEHLAPVRPRRREEALRLRQPLAVELLAGPGVVAAHQALLLLQDVEPALVQQRRRDQRP